MYNTKWAVRLYVEAVKQSCIMVEYKVRGRSLGYERVAVINVPSSRGVDFLFKSHLLKKLKDSGKL